jgi:hypothetical protein
MCRICGHEGEHPAFDGREMMFGTRERFPYFKCSSCGCLQISKVPHDLARHYPPGGYYSFRVTLPESPPLPSWKRALKARRLDAALGNGGIAGSLLIKLAGPPKFRTRSRTSRFAEVTASSTHPSFPSSDVNNTAAAFHSTARARGRWTAMQTFSRARRSRFAGVSPIE